ncbi:MAG: Rpn family recombination-promoting nuclease/putative transposase [Clostridium sp.]|nr:Rpn family recombination-promoting nuclease/putative transposase [Clostridium sp.]MCM1207500.1 Rpn family recombination-promoting nuclease/putative transposase [Ruminococcus sp.]
MSTEIKNAINAADINAQYDEQAKRLIGNKEILAHILINTIEEFYGMEIPDVVKLIEGEPQIGRVPVEPGLTNSVTYPKGQRIVGLNTENSEINEGLVRFDIIFYVWMKDGLSQVIINVEIQKEIPYAYNLLNRAIFYASRLISSQKERDFVNTNYDDIKRVFSIWVCLNADENSMAYVHLTKDAVLGSCDWEGNLDLINIVLIGVAKELPDVSKGYKLHRLLGALLSDNLSVKGKLDIIKTEYKIETEGNIKKGVSVMCNLSEAIYEKGEEKKAKEIVISMYEDGDSVERIAKIVKMPIEKVKDIISSVAHNSDDNSKDMQFFSE